MEAWHASEQRQSKKRGFVTQQTIDNCYYVKARRSCGGKGEADGGMTSDSPFRRAVKKNCQ